MLSYFEMRSGAMRVLRCRQQDLVHLCEPPKRPWLRITSGRFAFFGRREFNLEKQNGPATPLTLLHWGRFLGVEDHAQL